MKNTKKKPVQPRNKYTAEDKAKARKYYLMGLNLQEISLLLGGCPVRTLEKWQTAEQWTKLKNLENIEIKAYELHQAGRSYKQIATMLGISTVTVWRYIYPVYGCSYKTYTQYLKVRFPGHTKYADYLLPRPRQYGADAIRKIRAIYEYKQKHYPKAGRRERTIKSIWSEFIKTHFYIHYSGFLVYSRINPDDIEDAQAIE